MIEALLLLFTLSPEPQYHPLRPEPIGWVRILPRETGMRVYLDGIRIKLNDVPKDAQIIEMHLEEDKVTIRALWFRSKGKP